MSMIGSSGSIDHGKSEELDSGPNLKKIARFKKLKNSSLYFQNDLAFQGRIGKASLSEFPEIYDSSNPTQQAGTTTY